MRASSCSATKVPRPCRRTTQVLGRQRVERLAHRALADPDFRRQLHLARQRLAGRPPPLDEPLHERVAHLLVERPEAELSAAGVIVLGSWPSCVDTLAHLISYTRLMGLRSIPRFERPIRTIRGASLQHEDTPGRPSHREDRTCQKDIAMSIPHCLVHSPKDTVGVVVVEGLKAGTDMLCVVTDDQLDVQAQGQDGHPDRPQGRAHATSRRATRSGSTARTSAAPSPTSSKGEHVHVHNVKTKRW